MTKQQLHELWAEVEAELLALKRLFDSSPDGVIALEHFDEYLSHNELGLALETLCDFLADSDGSAILTGTVGTNSTNPFENEDGRRVC